MGKALAHRLALEGADVPRAHVLELDGAAPPEPAAPLDIDVSDPSNATAVGAPAPAAVAAPEQTTAAEALARGAGQSASLGLGDEAAGVGAKLAAGDDIPRAGHRGVLDTRAAEEAAPLSGRTDYDVARDAERRANATTEREHKGAYRTGEVAGAVGTAALPIGGGAVEGASLLARAGQAAKVGAGVGAVAGFGNSEADTAGGVAKDTAVGAGLGGVTAPIAAEVARLGLGAARAARRMFGDQADRLLGGAAQREIELGSPELAAKAKVLSEPNSAEGRAARARAMTGADTDAIETRAGDLGKKVDELLQHGEHVKWHEDIASKGETIKKMMGRQQPPADGLLKADAVHDAVKTEWDQLAKDVDKGPGSDVIKRLQREAFDAYDGRLKKAIDTFDPNDPSGYVSERFMALDDLKRRLQQEIARGRVPFDDLMRDRMEAPLRTALEDPGLWGTGPAALQKVRNAGWTRRLRSSGSPERSFTADNFFGDAGPDPYHVQAQHDPGKLASLVKGAGTQQGALGARNLTDWADREAGLAEALTSHEGADPALIARAQRARQLSNEIAASMGERGQQAAAAEDMARINRPRELPPTTMGGRALAATPGAQKLAGVVRGPPVGERAQLLAQLEDVMSRSPQNRAAANRLRKMGSDVQMPSSLGLQTSLDTRARTGSGAAMVGRELGGAGARSVRAMSGASADSDQKTGQELALHDPEYGRVLAGKPPEQRSVAYASLMQTDAEFRKRQRARSEAATQQQNDQQQETQP